MKAIILAAGTGSRMGALTRQSPKCLLEINGIPILEYQLKALARAGITEVVVVAGHFSEKVRALCSGRCRVIVNDRYQQTNSIYSLWLGKPWLEGHDFILLNGDVLYDEQMFFDFIHYERLTACLVENSGPYRPDEYHVVVSNGVVNAFKRGIPQEHSSGESAQLEKFSAEDSCKLFARIDALISFGAVHGFPPDAYDVIFQGALMRPFFTLGRPWFEIDTPQDYEKCTHAKLDSSSGKLRRWQWRWRKPFLRALSRQPVRACYFLPALYQGALSAKGFDLQVMGPEILALAIRESRRLGIRLFLIWGSLLGCVRDNGFILNDQDIDVGVLPEDFAKLGPFKERMLSQGFVVRIDNQHKLSLFHPHWPYVYLDIDLVYEHQGQRVITNSDVDPKNHFSYYFPSNAFDSFREVFFAGVDKVLIPEGPELFLNAVYGDWKTPRKASNCLYQPLNLMIEKKEAVVLKPQTVARSNASSCREMAP